MEAALDRSWKLAAYVALTLAVVAWATLIAANAGIIAHDLSTIVLLLVPLGLAGTSYLALTPAPGSHLERRRVVPLVLPMLVGWLPTLSTSRVYNLDDGYNLVWAAWLLVFSLPLALIIAARVLAWSRRRGRPAGRALAFLAVPALCYGMSAATELDQWHDQSVVETRDAFVDSFWQERWMMIPMGRYIHVRYASDPLRTHSLEPEPRLLRKLRVGDTITVSLARGRLGIPWRRVEPE